MIHFGLEAHIICLTHDDYREIIQDDIPGPNADKTKANLLRSFPMPQHFINKNSSSPEKPRTINIFAAFVSSARVWAIVDFSRLVRLHVISKDEIWQVDYIKKVTVSLNEAYISG